MVPSNTRVATTGIAYFSLCRTVGLLFGQLHTLAEKPFEKRALLIGATRVGVAGNRNRPIPIVILPPPTRRLAFPITGSPDSFIQHSQHYGTPAEARSLCGDPALNKESPQ